MKTPKFQKPLPTHPRNIPPLTPQDIHTTSLTHFSAVRVDGTPQGLDCGQVVNYHSTPNS